MSQTHSILPRELNELVTDYSIGNRDFWKGYFSNKVLLIGVERCWKLRVTAWRVLNRCVTQWRLETGVSIPRLVRRRNAVLWAKELVWSFAAEKSIVWLLPGWTMKLSRVDNFPTNFGNERDARHGCVDSDHRIWFLVDVAECDPIDFVDIVLSTRKELEFDLVWSCDI